MLAAMSARPLASAKFMRNVAAATRAASSTPQNLKSVAVLGS